MNNNLIITLNAHLPFVRHPEYPKFLEEDWFYEAVNESYLPLLRMFYRLRDDKVKYNIVFSLSPTLVAMFKDALLSERLKAYMQSRLELGEKEINRLKSEPETQEIAKIYVDNIKQNIKFWENTCKNNILNAFDSLSNDGFFELITTCATHAYLPVFKDKPVAVNAQIETGIMQHQKTFYKSINGFWLPSNGYYPGLEDILKKHNIKWTELASHAFILSQDEPISGTYAPVVCPNGVYCFARDYFLTSLVWSSKTGYPSDPVYRDFYRDIGYDLPLDYVGPYMHEPYIRVFTGFKYWSISKNQTDKKIYNPHCAVEKTNQHALNFLYNLRNRARNVETLLKDNPVFTVSFDAELFGHFWYEGISWLENVLRFANKEKNLSLLTPEKYLRKNHNIQTLRPAFSSWGNGGYSQNWIDSNLSTKYLPHILESVSRMTELADRFPNQKSLKQRFLNQASRETLLLMASDWLFLMHDNTNSFYAENRIKSHIQNLYLVYDNMCKNAVNTEWLVKSEERNNIFETIDYNIFNSNHLEKPSPVYTTDYTEYTKK